MSADAADAITASEFDRAMAALGPFEPSPVLAVAVSGGSDSMALALLAARWATDHGGRILAVTVDHGLREAAAEEARQVGRWLAARGIAHEILTWRPGAIASGVQAAAREARYRLLADICRQRDILHLLVAHQRDDQAETVAMRQARPSGPDGLAGMPVARLLDGVRLLRPLLDYPHRRLVATLESLGQPWLEDPSNQDIRFERVRIRRRLSGSAEDPVADIAVPAAAEAERRESDLARAAAHLVSLYPAGYARLDLASWRALPEAERLHLLARLLATVGGGVYPPRRDRLSALADRLAATAGFAASTLAGCRILPEKGEILLLREAGRLPPPVAIRPGETVRWDRFAVTLAETAVGHGHAVAALGSTRRSGADGAICDEIPRSVRATLPAVWLGKDIHCLPNPGAFPVKDGLRQPCHALFMPRQPFVRLGTKLNAGLRVV